MSRFTEPLDLRPIDPPLPQRKTAERIAAIGRAMPAGYHVLTETQQRQWFNGTPFTAPVQWLNGVFVCNDQRITPEQIAAAQVIVEP